MPPAVPAPARPRVVLPRAPRRHEPENGRVACGEQESRARRFGQQRLQISDAPHIVNYHKRRLVCDHRAVPVLASERIIPAAEVVPKRLGCLPHLPDEIAPELAASRDPHDAIGERLPHHLVFGDRLGEHGFADAAHPDECDGLAMVARCRRCEECIAEAAQGLGPFEVTAVRLQVEQNQLIAGFE